MKETIYTIPLNDAFHAEDECPFCRLERDAEQHALEFILGKQSSYMEDDIRMETDRIGFCRHHYKMMYDFGNRLGCGLMLSTHLKKLNEEMTRQIKSFTSGKSTLMGRLKKTDLNPDAPETPLGQWLYEKEHSCYVCDHFNATYQRYLDTFFYMYKNRLFNIGSSRLTEISRCTSQAFLKCLVQTAFIVISDQITDLIDGKIWFVKK